ncbi:MAG: TIGR03943 family protein [Clostridiales bacterium]|jgi:putative membrane protein|nr:TIGR03943 family protein [Clostridiales bacterium]
MAKARNLDPQALIEAVCCLAFSIVLIAMAVNGSYLNYVTPRMQPYLIFAAIVMLAWFVSTARRVFQARRVARTSHCILMAIPIILLVGPKMKVSATEISNKYVPQAAAAAASGANTSGTSGFASSTLASASASKPLATPQASVAKTEAPSTDTVSEDDALAQELAQNQALAALAESSAEESDSDWPGLDPVAKRIDIDDDNFYPWLNEISLNLNKYAGYRVAVTGFILKDPEIFAENEFVPARLGMSCCVADLVPYGILCKYDNASELVADEWVTVEGVIQAGEYMGYPEAQLLVDKVTPAEEVTEYIYPY